MDDNARYNRKKGYPADLHWKDENQFRFEKDELEQNNVLFDIGWKMETCI